MSVGIGGNLVDLVGVYVIIYATVGVLASWYKRVTENCNLTTSGCEVRINRYTSALGFFPFTLFVLKIVY